MSDKKIVFEDGNAYERMMGVWSQIVGKEFIEWLNPKGGQSWIDIGCGTGAFTAQIAELCAPSQLLGIDPSEHQIEFARKRSMAHSATFQTGDATDLPCEPSSFDVATMALVLFFLPDPVLGMAEMKRVVKSEGTLAAYVLDIPGEGLPIDPIHAEFRKRGIDYPLPPSSDVSNIDKLEKLWTEEGIDSIECKQIKVSRSFKNFDEFWDINASVQAVTTVFDELNPQIIAEIRSNVEKELDYDSDGSTIIRGHANAIKGIV
ncbi:MAG: class I SAM-dependent methyltransferase [Deltaproteobacteria bacterium]|nr:class I SAM-dependent methyltransferase [Deltaproteobacteria bacterium]